MKLKGKVKAQIVHSTRQVGFMLAEKVSQSERMKTAAPPFSRATFVFWQCCSIGRSFFSKSSTTLFQEE